MRNCVDSSLKNKHSNDSFGRARKIAKQFKRLYGCPLLFVLPPEEALRPWLEVLPVSPGFFIAIADLLFVCIILCHSAV